MSWISSGTFTDLMFQLVTVHFMCNFGWQAGMAKRTVHGSNIVTPQGRRRIEMTVAETCNISDHVVGNVGSELDSGAGSGGIGQRYII